jgi:hypothetical protein
MAEAGASARADTTTPLVTIAIPCFNEEAHIEACLEDVFAQDYPAARLEVLVADGRSTDRTREILARVAERRPGRLRVIDNPRRLQAAGMNAMIAEAEGEIVVRMDVHARYASDYVRQCVAVLAETGADNVGGAQRARPKTFFQRALCAALESPLAVGGARYRSADAEGFVDTVFLGAFRREVFDLVGAYDPNAITNEDAELNQRILRAGGTVYLSRRIVVHYFPRDSQAPALPDAAARDPVRDGRLGRGAGARAAAPSVRAARVRGVRGGERVRGAAGLEATRAVARAGGLRDLPRAARRARRRLRRGARALRAAAGLGRGGTRGRLRRRGPRRPRGRRRRRRRRLRPRRRRRRS